MLRSLILSGEDRRRFFIHPRCTRTVEAFKNYRATELAEGIYDPRPDPDPSNHTYSHVPILDMGEWKDYFVLVMPLADESLEHNLEQENGAIAWEVAEPILVDVATALAALAGKVVHRDLKPGGVLC